MVPINIEFFILVLVKKLFGFHPRKVRLTKELGTKQTSSLMPRMLFVKLTHFAENETLLDNKKGRTLKLSNHKMNL